MSAIDGVPQVGDVFDGYGRVHDAVRSVLDFAAGAPADRISRDQARAFLLLTGWLDWLDEREAAAVLRRFAQTVPEVEQHPVQRYRARPVEAWTRDYHDGYRDGYLDALTALRDGDQAAQIWVQLQVALARRAERRQRGGGQR